MISNAHSSNMNLQRPTDHELGQNRFRVKTQSKKKQKKTFFL
jgi:hypothetical protein